MNLGRGGQKANQFNEQVRRVNIEKLLNWAQRDCQSRYPCTHFFSNTDTSPLHVVQPAKFGRAANAASCIVAENSQYNTVQAYKPLYLSNDKVSIDILH